jgi:pyridoxal phosphate enzyme (YggS family)
MSSVRENLDLTLARIEAARKQAIAPAPSTTLVAVTKTHPAATIGAALDAGHRVFGENRVQEAAAKWPGLRGRHSDIELHLIGPLQTNKVKDALRVFDVIQTLDRPKLAQALADGAEYGRPLRSIFVQINTGEEPQKSGVDPKDAPSLIALSRQLKLPLGGLMCIPPVDAEPAPHFAFLREIARAHDLPLLSMGMSADFETAIAFGATHVRIGTAIFGARAASE